MRTPKKSPQLGTTLSLGLEVVREGSDDLPPLHVLDPDPAPGHGILATAGPGLAGLAWPSVAKLF